MIGQTSEPPVHVIALTNRAYLMLTCRTGTSMCQGDTMRGFETCESVSLHCSSETLSDTVHRSIDSQYP